MFANYHLKRHVNLFGIRIDLCLYVDCETKEAEFWLKVDGRLREVDWAQPRFSEVETPAKAEELFRKVDFDRLAESLWLERREARNEAEPDAVAKAQLLGWSYSRGYWRNPAFPNAKCAKASNALEDYPVAA